MMIFRLGGVVVGLLMLFGLGVFGQNSHSVEADAVGGTIDLEAVGNNFTEADLDVCAFTDAADREACRQARDACNTEGGNNCIKIDSPAGKAACLGKLGTGEYGAYNVVTTVQYYYGGGYQVGENRGDYCMRNEELKQGCDYIGKDEPSASYNFQAKHFCCGVKLNTDVPFVGRCIATDAEKTQSGQASQATAFPRLMRALSNIVLTLILVGSMIMLVASGVMWAGGSPEQGKQMMRRVILSLVLLGASGIILRLINPVFFG